MHEWSEPLEMREFHLLSLSRELAREVLSQRGLMTSIHSFRQSVYSSAVVGAGMGATKKEKIAPNFF